MIETRDGLDNLDEIAATPGLDGLYIGPSDLSIALGLPPRAVAVDPGEDRQALAEAIDRVREACVANGIVPGMHCAGGAAAEHYASRRLPPDHRRRRHQPVQVHDQPRAERGARGLNRCRTRPTSKAVCSTDATSCTS